MLLLMRIKGSNVHPATKMVPVINNNFWKNGGRRVEEVLLSTTVIETGTLGLS